MRNENQSKNGKKENDKIPSELREKPISNSFPSLHLVLEEDDEPKEN